VARVPREEGGYLSPYVRLPSPLDVFAEQRDISGKPIPDSYRRAKERSKTNENARRAKRAAAAATKKEKG